MKMSREYQERFLRNIGIMNSDQLFRLKNTPIAVGGLGLGGSIFINLVRMGFEVFHIADPDTYERTNINRQRLAKETTVGRRKDEALLEEARAINPDVKVTLFKEGVNVKNVNEFLRGVEWVVDVVDVFAMNEKLVLNEEARKRGLPVASCGALGFGASVVIFDKTTPSFKELTGLSEKNDYLQNVQNFLQFICPNVPDYMREQLSRAMDKSTHIPFVVPGVEIAAAVATTEIAKRLLGLGKKVVAPQGIYIDPVNLKIELYRASYKERIFRETAKKTA